jgi:hypothetical protein
MGLVKIETGAVSDKRSFSSLSIGETFRFDGDLYLKTRSSVDEYNAFDFVARVCVTLDVKDVVEPVNSKLVVES